MAVQLRSPHPFAERILLFGGAGSGKTNTALSIINHVALGDMHVIESDYSMAYERAIAIDFPDVADRVHVHSPEMEWDDYTTTLAEVVETADPDVDWLVLDSISSTWEMVQSWYLQQVFGSDLSEHLIALKKQYQGDAKEYGRALSENMNWPVVKKEYAAKVYRQIQRWKGHLIITAEAKAVGRFDGDDVQMEFGPLGYKPSGESRLMYVAASNLFLDHPKRAVWRVTSTKDRNRDELDKETVDEFAIDYLMNVAGWERVKGKKTDAADTDGDA